MTTKLVVLLWGLFSTLRRIGAFVVFLAPSLGLFSLLHHWRWEQIPFKVRLEYAKRGFLRADDKISLYGLNETIYWTELDRWDYTDKDNSSPPPYSLYTLMSLKNTFIASGVLLLLHFIHQNSYFRNIAEETSTTNSFTLRRTRILPPPSVTGMRVFIP